jgi:hypothetical protein
MRRSCTKSLERSKMRFERSPHTAITKRHTLYCVNTCIPLLSLASMRVRLHAHITPLPPSLPSLPSLQLRPMITAAERELALFNGKPTQLQAIQDTIPAATDPATTAKFVETETTGILQQLLEIRQLAVTHGYLAVESAEEIAAKKAKKEQDTKRPDRWKYGKNIEVFRSPSGFEVLAGRSADSNEQVNVPPPLHLPLAFPSPFLFLRHLLGICMLALCQRRCRFISPSQPMCGSTRPTGSQARTCCCGVSGARQQRAILSFALASLHISRVPRTTNTSLLGGFLLPCIQLGAISHPAFAFTFDYF